jgi:hypothetical protein
VLPVQGQANTFIFMADRWNKTDLESSRYVWLPLIFDAENMPHILWKDQWTIGMVAP